MAHERCRCLSLAMDDGTDTGTFLAVAKLRSESLTLDGALIDIRDSNALVRLPERRAGGEFARVRLAAAGVLVDAQGDVLLQRLFLDEAVVRWAIAVPWLGTLEGPFRMTRLDFQGNSVAGTDFEIALESAGHIAFAASAAIRRGQR